MATRSWTACPRPPPADRAVPGQGSRRPSDAADLLAEVGALQPAGNTARLPRRGMPRAGNAGGQPPPGRTTRPRRQPRRPLVLAWILGALLVASGATAFALTSFTGHRPPGCHPSQPQIPRPRPPPHGGQTAPGRASPPPPRPCPPRRPEHRMRVRSRRPARPRRHPRTPHAAATVRAAEPLPLGDNIGIPIPAHAHADADKHVPGRTNVPVTVAAGAELRDCAATSRRTAAGGCGEGDSVRDACGRPWRPGHATRGVPPVVAVQRRRPGESARPS